MSTDKFAAAFPHLVYPVLNSRAATSTELPANDHRDSEKTNLPNQFIDPRVYLESLSRVDVNKITHRIPDDFRTELKEIKSIFKDLTRLIKSDYPFSSKVIGSLNPLLERFNEIMLARLEDKNLSKIVFNIINNKKDLDLSHSDNVPDELISIYDSPLAKYKSDGRNLNFFDSYEQEFLKSNQDLIKKTIDIISPISKRGLNELDYEKITGSLLNAESKEDFKNNYLNLVCDLVNKNFPHLNINPINNRFASSAGRLTSDEKNYLNTLNERILGTNGSPYNLLDNLIDLNKGLFSGLAKPDQFKDFQNNFKNFIDISEIIFAQV